MTDGDGDLSGGFEWACEHCGDRTPKHNPPCSNCGGMSFEKVPLDGEEALEDVESLVPTTRRAMIAYGAAAVLALAGGGWMTYREYTEPSIPDAPGHPDSVDGFEFATVEDAVLDAVNEERATALETSGSARAAAAYASAFTVNHRAATRDGADGSSGTDGATSTKSDAERAIERTRELYRRVGEFHIGDFQILRTVLRTDEVRGDDETTGSGDDAPSALDSFEDERDLASYLANDWLLESTPWDVISEDRWREFGFDLHAGPDGNVYASMVVGTGSNGLL